MSSSRFGVVVVVERGAVVVVAGVVVVVERGAVVVVAATVVVVSATVVVVSATVVVVSATEVVVVSGVGVSTKLTIGSAAPPPTLAVVRRRAMSVELIPGTACARRAARPAT